MTLFSPKGYGFDEIFSNPQLNGSKLPTEISFTIPQTPDKVIIGKNSFIAIQLNITQTREDGSLHTLEPIINAGTRAIPTAISVPYLSVNPGICFFNAVTHYSDSTCLAQIQDLQPTNTLYRIVYESINEQTRVKCTK